MRARRWHQNQTMTSWLGARPPAGSRSQMANKETRLGKCASCFFLPMRSGCLSALGAREAGLETRSPPCPVPLLSPSPTPPLLPLPPHPGVLGAASGGERPSAVPGVGESKGFFSFGWPDLAVPAVQNASDPVPLPAAASCGPRADSTAHQLAAIYFFSNPSPPSLSLSQKQQQQQHRRGGTKRCLSPPGTRGRIWRCPLPTKSEGTAPFSAFPSSSPPPPKK